MSNQKTPTTILLTPERKFHSFGYAARDFYHDLDPNEAKQWLYLEKFKMTLHTTGVSRPRPGPRSSASESQGPSSLVGVGTFQPRDPRVPPRQTFTSIDFDFGNDLSPQCVCGTHTALSDGHVGREMLRIFNDLFALETDQSEWMLAGA